MARRCTGGSDAAEDHFLASREGRIGIRGVGRDPRKTGGLGAAAVRIARVLEGVAHVHAAVAGELRIERETPEPAVVERVHLALRSMNGVGSNCPFLITQTIPFFCHTKRRPSGAKAMQTSVKGGTLAILSVANPEPLEVSAAAGP